MHDTEKRPSTLFPVPSGTQRLNSKGRLIFSWLDRNPQFILLLITTLGVMLVLRAQRGHFVIMHSLPADPWTIATHLYQGKGFTACEPEYVPFCKSGNQLTAMREPAPVLMFAGIMLINPSPMVGVVFEMVLYAAVIYVLYSSLQVQGRVYALAAAALWAFSIPVVQVVGDGTGDLEAAFWLAVGFLFFQKARISHRIWDWAWAGLFVGLAALSRSVLIAVAGGLVAGLLFERSLGDIRSRIRQLAIMAFVVCLVFVPWVIRNQDVFGVPIFGTTLTGYNLYRQNFIIGNEEFRPHYVGAKEAGQALQALVESGTLRGNEDEQQMQSYFMRESLRLISAYPIEYLRLVIFRFSALWFNSTVNAAYGEKPDSLDAAMVIEQGFVLIACIVGAWSHRRQFWPFILGVILSSAAYLFVTAQVRYLVEILPLIAALAASAIFYRQTPVGNATFSERSC